MRTDAAWMRPIKRKDGGAPPPPPLPFFDAATVGDWPPPAREWIVPDWLPVGRVTALYGDGGTGKTTLVQQLMTACAIGGRWLGMDVLPCRSVALLAEDDVGEIYLRQLAINRHHGIGMNALGPTHWMAGIGRDNALMTFERGVGTVTPAMDNLRRLPMDTGARLIVLDAAAAVYGGDEISRAQVNRFVTELTALAVETKSGVLLLAHPSLSGLAPGGSKSSGSTQWSNAVRSRWSFTRPVAIDGAEDHDARVLTLEKANWARRGATIPVRFSGGVFVIPGQGGAAEAFDAVSRQLQAERVFLDLLSRFDRPLSSSSSSAGNYAPKLFAQRPDREGFTKREFQTAMASLMASRVIVDVPYGRPSDVRFRVALAAADLGAGAVEGPAE